MCLQFVAESGLMPESLCSLLSVSKLLVMALIRLKEGVGLFPCESMGRVVGRGVRMVI